MQIYLAPMEGVTGYILRNAFQHHFGCIDKYFTPFIPAAKRMNYKIKRDIHPDNNREITLVPQLISNRPEEVLDMIRQLEDFGYREFNINLGCPSGTVVSKKRGSGLLRFPEELDLFLDGVYARADVPVSLKTRIGFSSLQEWPLLLSIFRRYQASELIIHPRLREEQYRGFTHLDAFAEAYEIWDLQNLCYNGDIRDMDSYRMITERFPKLEKVMIGRGLLADPALCCRIKGQEIADLRSSLKNFLDEIYEGYLAIFDGEKDVVMHMKEIWCNLKSSFKDSDKLAKKLLKCQSGSEYKTLVSRIFDTLQLKDD